jgi:hypothetical protein
LLIDTHLSFDGYDARSSQNQYPQTYFRGARQNAAQTQRNLAGSANLLMVHSVALKRGRRKAAENFMVSGAAIGIG